MEKGLEWAEAKSRASTCRLQVTPEWSRKLAGWQGHQLLSGELPTVASEPTPLACVGQLLFNATSSFWNLSSTDEETSACGIEPG